MFLPQLSYRSREKFATPKLFGTGFGKLLAKPKAVGSMEVAVRKTKVVGGFVHKVFSYPIND